MNQIQYIFGSSIITLFIGLVFLIFIFVQLKNLVQRKRKTFVSNIMTSQLLLNLAGAFCILKIIEFISFDLGRIPYEVRNQAIKGFFTSGNTFFIRSWIIVAILILVALFRYKERSKIKWYQYSNFIIVPASVFTLHYCLLKLFTG